MTIIVALDPAILQKAKEGYDQMSDEGNDPNIWFISQISRMYDEVCLGLDEDETIRKKYRQIRDSVIDGCEIARSFFEIYYDQGRMEAVAEANASRITKELNLQSIGWNEPLRPALAAVGFHSPGNKCIVTHPVKSNDRSDIAYIQSKCGNVFTCDYRGATSFTAWRERIIPAHFPDKLSDIPADEDDHNEHKYSTVFDEDIIFDVLEGACGFLNKHSRGSVWMGVKPGGARYGMPLTYQGKHRQEKKSPDELSQIFYGYYSRIQPHPIDFLSIALPIKTLEPERYIIELYVRESYPRQKFVLDNNVTCSRYVRSGSVTGLMETVFYYGTVIMDPEQGKIILSYQLKRGKEMKNVPLEPDQVPPDLIPSIGSKKIIFTAVRVENELRSFRILANNEENKKRLIQDFLSKPD